MNWLSLKHYQYNLVTSLYMLEPWERLLFNSVAVGLMSMSAYTFYTYGPDYLRRTVELVYSPSN